MSLYFLIGAEHTGDFKCPHGKKSKALRLVERGVVPQKASVCGNILMRVGGLTSEFFPGILGRRFINT